jgi:hypothetical protein
MAITFKVDSTTAEGTFIRVLRDGRPFGKILDAVGLYRFYEADHEKLGSADLKDVNLDRLKTAIQSRYERRGWGPTGHATQRAAWEALKRTTA